MIAAPVSAALLLLAVTWLLDSKAQASQSQATPIATPALVALDTSAVPARTTAPVQPAADAKPAAALRQPETAPVLAPVRADRQAGVRPVVTAEQPLTFNNRPIRPVKTLRMLTTAYSPDEQSCGIFADGITASGYSVYTNGMALVAADTRLLPFGTLVSIPGYNDGQPVPVLDRGGKIKGNRLDLLYPTHERALQWGAQRLDVVVYEYADE
ncbi:MAG: 3D domain-containing protein [Planctomycetota bacterium]